MKNFLAALALLVLAGCAVVAPMQNYRPANYAGNPWLITGEWNGFSGNLTIRFNGQPVLNGPHFFALSGDLWGTYEGRPVAATCMPGYGMRGSCFVTVAGEHAATLSF